MKFTATKSDIVEAARAVASIVPKNPSVSLLGNLLLEIIGDDLKLTGSDFETWVCVKVPVKVSTSGETTVPSKIFTDLVTNLPGDEVTFSMDGESQMVMTSSNAKMTLNCSSATDYPRAPKILSGDTIKLDKETLVDIVEKVTPALSDRMEDRRELLGALVSVANAKLSLVGTDGQRLSICEIPVPGTSDLEAIVAGTVWRNLTKLIGNVTGGEIKLTFSPTQVSFAIGNVEVVSRLIEGDYPPFRQVVPTKFEYKVIVDSKVLLSALTRVNIIVSSGSRKVTLIARDSQLICKGIAPEIGEVEEKIEAQTDGADVELSFDIRKLIDGIKVASSPAVQININGPLHPVLIQPEGDDSFRYILVTSR